MLFDISVRWWMFCTVQIVKIEQDISNSKSISRCIYVTSSLTRPLLQRRNRILQLADRLSHASLDLFSHLGLDLLRVVVGHNPHNALRLALHGRPRGRIPREQRVRPALGDALRRILGHRLLRHRGDLALGHFGRRVRRRRRRHLRVQRVHAGQMVEGVAGRFAVGCGVDGGGVGALSCDFELVFGVVVSVESSAGELVNLSFMNRQVVQLLQLLHQQIRLAFAGGRLQICVASRQ